MPEFYPLLETLLRESRRQKVNGALEAFIAKEINIPSGIRSKAGDSQRHLREFLSSERQRDSSFPRVLSIADDDFLGGSFARHTKNWPLDDIDIYIPLDGHSLVYWDQGIITPNTVLSDGVLNYNPLLSERWGDSSSISSSKLVCEFAAVLRRHYPEETQVYANGQAVSIRMSLGATEEADGLGYDIVPCFSLKPHDSNKENFYLIPNGSNGWWKTNPRIDTRNTARLHENNNKTFRKVVKLIKYWNGKMQDPYASYYLELALTKVYADANRQGQKIDSLSHGIALGFATLLAAIRTGNLYSEVPGALPVQPGTTSVASLTKLQDAQRFAGAALNFERNDQTEEALKAWKVIFGETFEINE